MVANTTPAAPVALAPPAGLHGATRTPLLVRAMQWAASLSRGEAIACIRDYRAGNEYSSEAVAHYGGSTAVIRAAIRHRHAVAALYRADAAYRASLVTVPAVNAADATPLISDDVYAGAAPSIAEPDMPTLTREHALTAGMFHWNGNGGCYVVTGPRGGITVHQTRARRNGATQTWKTRPDEYRVPVKHGIRARGQFSIYHHDARSWHAASQCPIKGVI